MKNLTQNYNKIQLQKLIVRIHSYYHHPRFVTEYNKIGFDQHYYSLNDKKYVNNFYDYSHIVCGNNHKLYKKYPHDVTKKDYKAWLKEKV